MTRRRPHHTRKHRHPNLSPAELLTHEQQQALIPAGPSNLRQRLQRPVDLEARGKSEAGATLVTGEIVSSVIRRLYQQGEITSSECWAGGKYQADHDIAFCSMANPLGALHVDSGGGPGDGGITRRIHHATQFRRATEALGPELAQIAKAVILEDSGSASFYGVGTFLAPHAGINKRRDIGKDAVIQVLRKLDAFYAR